MVGLPDVPGTGSGGGQRPGPAPGKSQGRGQGRGDGQDRRGRHPYQEGKEIAQRLTYGKDDPRLPALLAIVASMLLYVSLPSRLTVGPWWLLPALEVAIALFVVATTPRAAELHHWVRGGSLVAVGLITAANVTSLVLLLQRIVHGSSLGGSRLFFGAVEIWLTNVVGFGLWFWEVDRGGPLRRGTSLEKPPDLLFPQMTTPSVSPAGWMPAFIDYLYVSLTNATAFSPTDTMPLTAGAKALFSLGSLVSLLTVALVAGRAVNLL